MNKLIILMISLSILPLAQAEEILANKNVVLNEFFPDEIFVPIDFYVGSFATPDGIKNARTLQKFEINSDENIHRAELILEAKLEKQGTNNEKQILEIHRVLEDWEKPVWNSQPEYDMETISFIEISNSGNYKVDITKIARSWTKDNNFGILMKSQNNDQINLKQFRAKSILNITITSSLKECEIDGGTCKFSCDKNEKLSDLVCNKNEICCKKLGESDLQVKNIKFNEIDQGIYEIFVIIDNAGEIQSNNYDFKAFVNNEEFVSGSNMKSLSPGEEIRISLGVRRLSEEDMVKVIVDLENKTREETRYNNNLQKQI